MSREFEVINTGRREQVLHNLLLSWGHSALSPGQLSHLPDCHCHYPGHLGSELKLCSCCWNHSGISPVKMPAICGLCRVTTSTNQETLVWGRCQAGGELGRAGIEVPLTTDHGSLEVACKWVHALTLASDRLVMSD